MPIKQQKNRFEYDACGNMTYEYMRGNGTGEATVEVFYTYDELHQVTHAQENSGNKSRSYQYDYGQQVPFPSINKMCG